MSLEQYLLVTIGAAAAVLLIGAPAFAKEGDVLVRGRCTAGSTSKLKLSGEDGRIEAEFEVDQNRNGVTWNVTLRRNSRVVATGGRVTRAPSGSFEFRRLLANRPAADVIRASARRGSGEVCSAAATWRR